MHPPIPHLPTYSISPTHGFLPESPPLSHLPDPYYNKWEAITTNLQSLTLSRRLRSVIHHLPVLSTHGLEHPSEWRRAYSLLSFIAHSYIWCGPKPSERLPAAIAVPLLQVAERLEVPPVATYAGVCLWNWKPLFLDEEIDSLSNLATLTTFTGSMDESWFYLVSVAIEARGAPIIPLMLTAMAAARDGDEESVARCLRGFAERLDDLIGLLGRMAEGCDARIFYTRIRPFLAGSKNMAEAGLPRGVVYETEVRDYDECDEEGGPREEGLDGGLLGGEFMQYSGGSNAQSSLIQFFDVALGIEHRPTGGKASVGDDDRGRSTNSTAAQTSATGSGPRNGHGHGNGPPSHNFITEMRTYMPGPHARFLEDVTTISNIRPFVQSRAASNKPLAIAYDACLAMLRAFRDKHISIVTRYIIVPSREVRARSRSPEVMRRKMGRGVQHAVGDTATTTTPAAFAKNGNGNHPTGPDSGTGDAATKKPKQPIGTGGTSLIPFLKQARDETGEPAVEDWTRRFMSRGGRVEGRNDFFFGKYYYPGGESASAPSARGRSVGAAGSGDGNGGPVGGGGVGGARGGNDNGNKTSEEEGEGDAEVEVKGLAGTWTMEDFEGGGGICLY